MTSRERVRLLVAAALTLAIVVPLGTLWWTSRVPTSYAATDLGEMDYGGGPHATGHRHGDMAMAAGSVSVRDLDTPRGRPADVVVSLTARQGRVHLASGRTVDGYTLNGTSPGPLIEATVGDLVEVRVHNADVTGGITLHWHGVDVPNAEDGVAGVTQDAVLPGQDHTYHWIAPHSGTFWYHSHQLSHAQVTGGLFGGVLIHPRQQETGVQDVVALAHLYAGTETIDGREGDVPFVAPAGRRVRLRVVNTDNGPQTLWTAAAYRLVATDGYDVHGPTEVTGRSVVVPAGGRVDLEVVVPRQGAVRVQYGEVALVVGPRGSTAPRVPQPTRSLDLLHYGSPAPVPFDADHPDRRFTYSIGRRPGFVHGEPGMWWSVDGKIGSAMPMFVVRRGDVVQVRYANHSGQVHPMHLHGHHGVVLSRDGVRTTGSPWWFDSLDVRNGESFEVAFLADNPGIWMDHCHNLDHASQGLVTHLMYEGVTTPYRLGSGTPNAPE